MGVSLIEIDSLAMLASPEPARELTQFEERTLHEAVAKVRALDLTADTEQTKKALQHVLQNEPDYHSHVPAVAAEHEPHSGSIFSMFHRAMHSPKPPRSGS